MLNLADLARPIIAAPMAGGPTTPQLVAAVSAAGGFGILATGYLNPGQLRQQLREVRQLTDASFGANLFVPNPVAPNGDNPRRGWHRNAMTQLAGLPGAGPAGVPHRHHDWYQGKLEVIKQYPPAVILFAFGLPSPAVIDWLHGHDTACWITVTSLDEAIAAAARGADALCVQGPGAGGHQTSFAPAAGPAEMPLERLLRTIKTATGLPLIAAGGVRHHQDVTALLQAGADAVQVGTVLMGAFEAGTKAAHLTYLRSNPPGGTVATGVFGEWPAQALVSDLTARYDRNPGLHREARYLRLPLDGSGAGGDSGSLRLWAGTGYAAIRCAPAAQLVELLSPDTPYVTDERALADGIGGLGKMEPGQKAGDPGWLGGIDGLGGPLGRPGAVTLGIIGLGRRGLALLDRFAALVRAQPGAEFSLAVFDHTTTSRDRSCRNTEDAAVTRFLRTAPPNLSVRFYRANVSQVSEQDGLYHIHFDDLRVPCSRVIFCDAPDGCRWPSRHWPERPGQNWEQALLLAPGAGAV